MVPVRFLGGGELTFTPVVNGVAGVAIVIGEMQDFTINRKTDSKSAYNYKNGYEDKAQEVMTMLEYTFKFSSLNLNIDNLKLAFNGTALTQAEADAVLAGATEGLKVTKLLSMIEGSMQYVCTNLATNQEEQWDFPNISLKADGDLALLTKEFEKLKFSGNIYADDNDIYFTQVR